MRKVFSILLSLLVVLSLATPAAAAGGSLTINSKKDFIFKPGVYTDTDLFDEDFKGVMPGDMISSTVTIKSGFSFKEDSLKVYLRADPHDATNLPVTGQNVASMNEFLHQLKLRVYNLSDKGKLIFEGQADELDGLRNNVYLGTFRKGGKIQLKVELEVPIELDNRYADRVGEVDWVFTVEAFDDPTYDNPKTGDYYILAAVAVMAVSGVALIMLLIRKKRKK